jgi:hypothetical protein
VGVVRAAISVSTDFKVYQSGAEVLGKFPGHKDARNSFVLETKKAVPKKLRVSLFSSRSKPGGSWCYVMYQFRKHFTFSSVIVITRIYNSDNHNIVELRYHNSPQLL